MKFDKIKVAQRRESRSFPQDIGFAARSDAWFTYHVSEIFHWLDIGCGPGDLVKQISNLFIGRDERVHYHGYDVVYDFAVQCQAVAESLGLSDRFRCHTGELSALSHHFSDMKYDGITLINVLHELPLWCVPDLILDALNLCTDDGFVYLFDIASLPYLEPEPGALPWRASDVAKLLNKLCDLLNARVHVHPVEYKSSQGGWYCIVNRRLFPHDIDQFIKADRARIVDELNQMIFQTFRGRRSDIDREIQRRCHEVHERELVAPDQGEKRSMQDSALWQLVQSLDMQFRSYWACDFELSELSRRKESVGATQ